MEGIREEIGYLVDALLRLPAEDILELYGDEPWTCIRKELCFLAQMLALSDEKEKEKYSVVCMEILELLDMKDGMEEKVFYSLLWDKILMFCTSSVEAGNPLLQ